MSGNALSPITGAAILTSLFDAQIDPSADDGAGVVLSSLHAVKGREFRKVVLLLRGDWLDQDDERRLFYVGMTRARDELLLVAEEDHDALDEIGLPVTMALDVPTEPDGPHFYHTECNLHDVQLGHEATIAEQERIQHLREGDPLNLVPGPKGRWNITAADGTIIGGLSKDQTHDLAIHRISMNHFLFASGEVTVHQIRRCRVDSIYRWLVLPAIQVARPHALDTTDPGNEILKVYL